MKYLITLFISLLIHLAAIGQSYNILDFGAVADSSRLNTKSIQAAIDKCYSDGGGEVIIPHGNFVSGTIFLKSNVYLKLMPGSVLQGSYNPSDYPDHPISIARKYGTITHNGLYVDYMRALIIADGAHHIAITGSGSIRGAGDGQAFQLGLNKDGKPKNIFFIGCKDVLLQDVKILNSAQITVSISGCERVRLSRLFVQSVNNWNCDGIDIDAKDVTVSDCIIDSEDDALCFKSEYLDKYCENITVTNCIVSSICNGIKFGTGSRSGFRNVTIDNCVIKKPSINGYRHFEMKPEIIFEADSASVNSGIVVASVDGGIAENINISNIVMTDVLSAIFIRAGKRFLTPDGKPSQVHGINIQNIIAETRSIFPPITIAGVIDSRIRDVKISNVRVNVPIGVNEDLFKTFPEVIPENEKRYPENRMFGEKLPADAIFIRHAEDITIKDYTLRQKQKDVRPCVYLDHVSAITLENILVNKKKLIDSKSTLRKKLAENVVVR